MKKHVVYLSDAREYFATCWTCFAYLSIYKYRYNDYRNSLQCIRLTHNEQNTQSLEWKIQRCYISVVFFGVLKFDIYFVGLDKLSALIIINVSSAIHVSIIKNYINLHIAEALTHKNANDNFTKYIYSHKV